jgi:hypothetical protein
MAATKEKLEITTEIWGLNIVFKAGRLGVVFTTPEGHRKVSWTPLPPKMAETIKAEIEKHVAAKEANAKLTPQELADKYAEMMGT